jgi:hypothetical protein
MATRQISQAWAFADANVPIMSEHDDANVKELCILVVQVCHIVSAWSAIPEGRRKQLYLQIHHWIQSSNTNKNHSFVTRECLLTARAIGIAAKPELVTCIV